MSEILDDLRKRLAEMLGAGDDRLHVEPEHRSDVAKVIADDFEARVRAQYPDVLDNPKLCIGCVGLVAAEVVAELIRRHEPDASARTMDVHKLAEVLETKADDILRRDLPSLA